MATFTDQLLVYVDGRTQKIGAEDAIVIGGSFTANSFSGDGSALTNLDATNISSGTIADAYLSANVPLLDAETNTFTGDVSAASFSGDGAGLTDLDADNISAGTLDDARLSSNVPLKDAASNAFTGSMSVGGDLVVAGDIISAGAQSVIIGDNFLDLNAGNTVTASAMAGGLSVNVQAQGTPVTGTDFVAGVAATSNPVITVSSDPTGIIASGDLIQVSGSADNKNDGQYVVVAVDSSSITVAGIGTQGVPSYVPFAHNQFVAQTSQTATVTKAIFSVIAASNGSLLDSNDAAIPAGRWAQAKGSTADEFDGQWIPCDPNAAATLQNAYNNGNVINLTDGRTFTVQPGVDQTAAFSLVGTAASQLRTQGGVGLTIVAEEAGDLDIGSDGGVMSVNFGGSRAQFGSPITTNYPVATGVASTSGVAAGDICYFDSSGVAQLSDGDAGTYAAREVAGVATSTADVLASFAGQRVVVKYAGSAPARGDMLWLSATAGQATNTLPTSGRVTRLGMCVVAGAGGTCSVVWNPQYIADL